MWTPDSVECYRLKQACDQCPLGRYGRCFIGGRVENLLQVLGPPNETNTFVPGMRDGHHKGDRGSRAVRIGYLVYDDRRHSGYYAI
jgi:hypothetical protein